MYKQPEEFPQQARHASWAPAVALGLLVLLIAAASPVKAVAQNNFNPTFTFPMAAIIEGETARLNIVNRTGSPGNLPPDVCDVALIFLDKNGVMRAGSSIKGLRAGHAVHLDLSASKLREETGNRHELRAFVSVTAGGNGKLPPDVCKPSMEIYNETTGETKYFASPPEPDLPAPQ